MTRDLTEKNLVEEAEVFADISNVNLYDGRNVIRPEDLELLPQEMHYKDSEGKPAKVMADVRMRWRKNGSVIAMIQIENQSEINNIMPIRDLGYIFNNYNEQIKEHQRENERNGYGKTRKYLEEESGKRKLKHPEEVQNVLYALSSDKRFLEANLAKKGKEEPKMGQISDVLDQIEAIMFDKGVEQGIEQERKHLQRVNQLHAELIKDDRTAELFQATQDSELQEKLMKEYGIE